MTRGASGASLRADLRQRREHGRRRVRPGRRPARRRTRARPSSKRRSSSSSRARPTSTCASPSEAAARRQPARAARGAERDRVHRRRVGAVLHREDRGRQRGHRREDGADPGGPRPGARRATTARSRTSTLIDKRNIHNNRLQVINQYEVGGDGGATRANRYDVTVLVNGLPLVHVELKRRGVDIREAFNQINRYQRDSFWAGSGLFEYVQLFVISNGTLTKYYSQHHPRRQHLTEQAGGRKHGGRPRTRFEFTSWWADASNRPIARPDRLHEDVLRQAHAAQHPDAVLRLRRRPQAAGDAAVPDRRRPSGSCSGSRPRPTTSSSARSRPAATSGTPPARARR